MPTIFLGIGSNLGQRFENIQNALRLISPVLSGTRLSVIYETAALLPPDAPSHWDLPFLNAVVCGHTMLAPGVFLKVLREMEEKLGRDVSAPKWSPRIIDLDILAWGDQVICEESLKIPHPELLNRPFFVSLMASLHPDWRYPVSGTAFSGHTLDEILHYNMKPVSAIRSFVPRPQFVGIVNVTPDSFSDGGCYAHPDKAFERIQELASEGAAVIDIGAQSTRPGAARISPEEEWRRLEPVLKLLKTHFSSLRAKPEISLDTYDPWIVQKSLELYSIDWINDVQGGKVKGLLEMAAQSGCKIVLNHSLTVPPEKKSVLPFEGSCVSHICGWAKEKIQELQSLGISSDKIIIDPGIGFGKSTCQSIRLLQESGALKSTGCKILVGHSRKSFLQMLPCQDQGNRDEETLGISHYLSEQNIDYLRVHRVAAHHKFLAAKGLLDGGFKY